MYKFKYSRIPRYLGRFHGILYSCGNTCPSPGLVLPLPSTCHRTDTGSLSQSPPLTRLFTRTTVPQAWVWVPALLLLVCYITRRSCGTSLLLLLLSHLSRVRLCCDPMDCSLPGSSIHGILQARTLEWVAISFSNAWKWKVKVKSLSRVWLLATPWTAAHQAPPSMGFSRQEYWSGLPLPSPKSQLILIYKKGILTKILTCQSGYKG